MRKEEGEDADQENSHEQVGIVQDGIFRPISLLRVRIVFRKALCSAGMALPAGRDNVVLGKPGTGIRRRQDLVRAVAVGTFGDRRVPQCGNLAVIGLPVCIHLLGVAGAALFYE